ncbi:hypothetical protein RLOC_00007023 [Lonchura striata]|uniref:Uncharacterized protein n=1 Tax=Lonchura striata TaxID=40157 RepID=A0A218UNS8_9PASE|nr:hypothetical protein RLOC_00007023 [Lonchura striata domestica]
MQSPTLQKARGAASRTLSPGTLSRSPSPRLIPPHLPPPLPALPAEPGLEHDAILIYSRACPGCPGLLTSTGGHSQAAEDTGTCPPCPLHCGPLAGEERKAGRIGKFFTKKKKRKKKSRQPQEICVNCL